MNNGVILIHGLTGSPSTMAPLTERLSKAGFRVKTPLLAGHGTSPNDLSSKKWGDWYASALNAYQEMRDSGIRSICCAGISLGSLLTLKLAEEKGIELKKIALLSTPLRLPPLLEWFLLPLSHLPPIEQICRMTKKTWDESVSDENGRDIYRAASYDRIPLHSVWEVHSLAKEVEKKLNMIDVPVLAIHARRDKVAPLSNMDILKKKIAPAKLSTLMLERSEHVITLDHEKDIVAEKLANFFS